MIKVIQEKSLLHILTYLSFFIIFLSGCSPKEPQIVVQKEYIYEKPFDFVIYDTEGIKVNAKTKELQRMCTPVVLEVSDIYNNFLKGYEEQINEYNTYHKNKEVLK